MTESPRQWLADVAHECGYTVQHSMVTRRYIVRDSRGNAIIGLTSGMVLGADEETKNSVSHILHSAVEAPKCIKCGRPLTGREQRYIEKHKEQELPCLSCLHKEYAKEKWAAVEETRVIVPQCRECGRRLTVEEQQKDPSFCSIACVQRNYSRLREEGYRPELLTDDVLRED